MNLYIRKAAHNELDIALNMLYDAAIWLKSIHVDYWQDWLDPPENFVAWIKQGIDNLEFYFAESNDELVGMFRLQYADEIFWGKRNETAGYIHSFTTNRKYKNRKLGYAILDIIKEKIRSEGIEYLRLDCAPHIEKLCKYYENYGFEPKETVNVFGEELRLYEKKISEEEH